MKKVIEPGTRVAVYGWTYRGLQCFGAKATVASTPGQNRIIDIRFDRTPNGPDDSVHVNQCRILRKSNRHRNIWLHKGTLECHHAGIGVMVNVICVPPGGDAKHNWIRYVKAKVQA